MGNRGKYLTSNERDSLWGLQVTCVGTQSINIQEHYPPIDIHPKEYMMKTDEGRTLDEYQLVYLVSGEGIFESRHCPLQKIQAGSAFLLFPDEWHSYRPLAETGWIEYWVGFKGKDIDDKVTNRFFSRHSPVFHVGLSEQLVNLYSQLIQLAQIQSPGYRQIMAGTVSNMLGIVYSQSLSDTPCTPQIEEMVNRAKAYVSGNLQSPLTSAMIAAYLKVSHLYFCRKFKQYTGFSPAKYILGMRIQRSKQLLYSTGLNSQQIAYDCGFESSGYFCTVFQKKTGMTPLQYRRMVCGAD